MYILHPVELAGSAEPNDLNRNSLLPQRIWFRNLALPKGSIYGTIVEADEYRENGSQLILIVFQKLKITI